MTDTDDTETRGEIIAGLRELADLLDKHPEVPAPDFAHEYVLYGTRERAAAIVAATGAAAEVDGTTLTLKCTLRGMRVQWVMDARDILEKREILTEQYVLPDEMVAESAA